MGTSSVPALYLLTSIRALGLPEAYLELQVERKGSFFVYQSDLWDFTRRRVERERDGEGNRWLRLCTAFSNALSGSINANGKRTAPTPAPSHLRLLQLLEQKVEFIGLRRAPTIATSWCHKTSAGK